MNLINKLNELKALSDFSKQIEISGHAKIYGNHLGSPPYNRNVVIQGRENVIEFDKISYQIWKKDSKLFQSIQLKSFQNLIVQILRDSFVEKRQISQTDIQNLKRELASRPIVKEEIFKEILGCNIISQTPFSVNEFNFYSWPKHSEIIKNRYPDAFKHYSKYFYDEEKTTNLVSINLESRDSERNLETAELKFKTLENVLRFLITKRDHSIEGRNMYDIGIYDHRDHGWEDSIIVDEITIGSISKLSGTYKKFDITEEFLIRSNKSRKLWKILNKKQKSKLESRIINSVEWIGKAKHELNSDKALIQYLFAIEALMNFHTTGIISPSTGASIREAIALLIGKNEEDRHKLDRVFTRLYTIRSSIVHGGSKEFSNYDIEDAENLAEHIVFEFLTNDDLSELSLEKIQELIKHRKYASR